MGEVKPTLIIEDCSALGQISTVAATTVLQALGKTTALLPTSLLSTQTEGFGQPARLDTGDWLTRACHHWQSQEIQFGNALVGYLGQRSLVARVKQVVMELQPTSLIVDPVMADRGRLYPGLPADYPEALRLLCQQATVITPNWTELCLLTGQSIGQANTGQLLAAMHQLRKSGITAQVVVTGVPRGNSLGCWLVDSEQPLYLPNKYFPGHYYGAGDVFAALLTGLLSPQHRLRWAVATAEDALALAIEETSHLSEASRRYGLRMTALLAKLTQREW